MRRAQAATQKRTAVIWFRPPVAWFGGQVRDRQANDVSIVRTGIVTGQLHVLEM